VNEQLWWYVARSTGIVAWAVLTLSLLWGVVLSTRLLGRRARPAWLLDLHRYLGGLASVFTVLHLVSLVADSYVEFGPTDLLVPMASAWKPGPVAWGVAALYLLAAVEVTSLLKKRLPMKVWRRAHLLSFPLWVVATVHFAAAGTDTGNRLAQWMLAVAAVATLFTIVVRVLSPKPQRSTSAPRTAATAGAP
jgi:methionine sulfoxide reductase heme-binding subunit